MRVFVCADMSSIVDRSCCAWLDRGTARLQPYPSSLTTCSQQFSQQSPQRQQFMSRNPQFQMMPPPPPRPPSSRPGILNCKYPTTLKLQQWLHCLHQLWEPLVNLEGFRCGDRQVGRELPAGLTYLTRASRLITETPNAYSVVASPPLPAAAAATSQYPYSGSPFPQQQLQQRPTPQLHQCLGLHKGSLKSRARQFLVHQVGNDGLRDKAFSMYNSRLSLVVSAGVG